MSFHVIGLDPSPFLRLYGLSDVELAAHGVKRCVVDKEGTFPERVELRDMLIGETALLLNFAHQPDGTFYRSSHAVFVREGANAACTLEGVLPDVMRVRPLSLRAFDRNHDMVSADLVDGAVGEGVVIQMLEDPDVSYIHAHYAKRGCYAARIERC